MNSKFVLLKDEIEEEMNNLESLQFEQKLKHIEKQLDKYYEIHWEYFSLEEYQKKAESQIYNIDYFFRKY